MTSHFVMRALGGAAFILLGGSQLAAQTGPAQAQLTAQHQAALQKAIDDAARTPAHSARDKYRHPLETLSFFGVRPSDTVVEIWPGGGWYTEVLAPYLAGGGGKLIVATLDGQLGGVAKLREAQPAVYASLGTATFPAFDA